MNRVIGAHSQVGWAEVRPTQDNMNGHAPAGSNLVGQAKIGIKLKGSVSP